MFKVGELVTGKDRSYRRSIYRLEKVIDRERGLYRPVAFGGNEVWPMDAKRFTHVREHAEFRLAELKEIKEAGYTALVPLLDLLHKLGVGDNF